MPAAETPSGPITPNDFSLAWDQRIRDADLLTVARRRTVVVAPHPDDESLGTGGLIMRQLARGAAVVVVAVTDGEAAYAAWPGPHLAATRRDEQFAALGILGVPVAHTVRLGLPDSAVAEHESELVEELSALVEPGDIVVAPWVHDWHPDHEACGRAAQTIAARHSCTLLGSLFWALHHTDPGLHPDIDLAVLALTDLDASRRHAALRAHTSQFAAGDQRPILDGALLEAWSARPEPYVVSTPLVSGSQDAGSHVAERHAKRAER